MALRGSRPAHLPMATGRYCKIGNLSIFYNAHQRLIGKCDESGFFLHIIPETLRITSIGDKSEGDLVNIEIDSRTQAVVEAMMRMGVES